MFTKKEYEHCNIYYNPYEDIEVLQGTTDFLSVDVYIAGQHVFECVDLESAINYLHEIGVEFKVKEIKMNKVINKPTIDQLNESWNDFLKVGIYQDQRFGQWFYNQYEYEVGNSYNIERPYQAYQFLYENLVTTLDDVLMSEEK